MRRLAILLLALAPLTAGAWEVIRTPSGTPVRWPAPMVPVTEHINPTAAAAITDGSDLEAVRAGLAEWGRHGCSVSFTEGEPTSASSYDYSDGRNVVVWRHDWPREYGASALAVTTPYYNPSSGQMIDADVQFNPGVTWSTTSRPGGGGIDVQGVATHELGHVLGMGDIYDERYAESTMFGAVGPGDLTKRSLAPDDIAGLCYLYPGGSTTGCRVAADCAPGEDCVGGACRPVRQSYGGPCSSPTDCESSVCAGISETAGICTIQCDPASPSCPNGDDCVPTRDASVHLCYPGSGATGTGRLGDPCAARSDCQTRLCVGDPGGTSGICTQYCSDSEGCPEGYDCVDLVGGQKACYPSSPTPRDSRPEAPRDGGPRPDRGPDAGGAELGAPCAENGECRSGWCYPVVDGSVCGEPCGDGGACPEGFVCHPDPDATVCLPAGAVPWGAYGSPCGRDDECDSAWCLALAGSTVCTQGCGGEVGCPDGSRCRDVGGGETACVPAGAALPGSGGGMGGCQVGGSLGELGGVAGALLALGAIALATRRRPRRR